MILLMTEKKDQAVNLAAALGWTEKRGYFEGTFEGKKLRAVWARGHLLTLQSPGEVVEGLPWDDPSALVPIPQTYPMKIGDDIPGAPVQAQPRSFLSNIKKHYDEGISEFIIATDSDREGEAIGWYVLDYLGFKGPVRRAWFSAGLDKKSMGEAMRKLRSPNETKSWYRASESRGRSDWAYMFLVRAYTHFASYSVFGKNLGQGSGRSRVVSVGRVQTPALAMVVNRDIEIENFVSKDHFRISGFFASNGAGNLEASYYPEVTAEIIDNDPDGVTWEPSKRMPKEGEPEPLDVPLFTGKKEVDSFKERLLSNKDGVTVLSYAEGIKRANPPKTFSLSEAQAAVARECKVTAAIAQSILEDLYEQGWTSYARTSKSDLPMNFYEDDERNSILDSLSQLNEISNAVQEAKDIHNGKHQSYERFLPTVFTKKPLEHHGILPTQQVMTLSAFNSITPRKQEKGRVLHTREHMQKAYLIIAKQFIQALFPAAEYKTQTVSFSVDVEDILGNKKSIFRAKGESMTEPGWRAVFGSSVSKDSLFPAAKKGDPASLSSINLKASKTTAPTRYTDITFPLAMENVGKEVKDRKLRKLLQNSEGIGMPATRKSIIETLLARGFMEDKKGVYYSTPKGRDLIKMVPAWMSSPETTAIWEDYLVKMCEQKDDSVAIKMRDEFVGKQVAVIEGLIRELMNTYSGNLGEKIRSIPDKVTANMKNAVKKIAESKGIDIPKGALSNPKIASDFLSQHISSDAGSSEPSESQIKFAKSIAEGLPKGTVIPDNVWTDRNACSQFIDNNKAKAPVRKPSPAQAKFAKDLEKKLTKGEKAPVDLYTNSAVCSAFIKKYSKKK